jgi:hypothetical protein
MAAELWNLTEIGRYLNVSAERARQVAADDPTFPTPVNEAPTPLEPRLGPNGGPSGLGGTRCRRGGGETVAPTGGSLAECFLSEPGKRPMGQYVPLSKATRRELGRRRGRPRPIERLLWRRRLAKFGPPLVLLGYWRVDEREAAIWRMDEHEASLWPDPRQLVDPYWDPVTRRKIANYLRAGSYAIGYMGASTCRLCGRDNGSRELHDGVYLWPEGLVHSGAVGPGRSALLARRSTKRPRPAERRRDRVARIPARPPLAVLAYATESVLCGRVRRCQ